ncbi:hypothetical protein SAMD00019534_109260 [Acytostelium subglobosum LB1]|uniref:hypothetical protein n=1 Tax=Acytostelium subglobosum LB1 TaxID=1410327 RepID=UPI0006449264|nr:hypothetical protein SAMD00019534_109260 [Acytostelium subglobosum LB1]GAM27750.1 hypothetical protein SAMD00019534_109260 [Acytostelium subglobosum LB1]|eukprot:XP_012749409.1 hypothetical protein SAMD00019534_109260 [Acytostelium subglobosum LB1]
MYFEHLQSLIATYKTQTVAMEQVTEHYRVLHEALVIEEHKKKSPIVKEMDCTQDTIIRITKELTDIHMLFNTIKVTDSEPDNNALMNAVMSSSSANQYIRTIHPSTVVEPIKCTEHALLARFMECNENMSSSKYQLSHHFSTKRIPYLNARSGEDCN